MVFQNRCHGSLPVFGAFKHVKYTSTFEVHYRIWNDVFTDDSQQDTDILVAGIM